MTDKDENTRMNKLANRFLKWFCDPDLLPEIEGDLYEMYQRWINQYGKRKADWLYLRNVMTFFRLYAFKKRKPSFPHNTIFMNKHHFYIALRHMLRHKLYTLINLSSLVVGMVCCILVFLYVQHELSYDQYHAKKDHTYRLLERSEKLGINNAVLPGVAQPFLKNEIPTLEEVVRISNGTENIVSFGEETQKEKNFWFADPEILEILSFSFLKGNASKAFSQPTSVILTESTARRYFGDQDPIGQVIAYDHLIDLTVSGVIADIPEASHFNFDFLAPIANMEKLNSAVIHRWDVAGTYYYCLLSEGADIEQVEKQLTQTILEHNTNLNEQTLAEIEALQIAAYLEPLTKIHLYSSDTVWDYAKKGDITYVVGFSIIALLLLCIACFNFMNLTTANASQRAKEIGVKKTLGAARPQLMAQFYQETLLFTVIALLLSMVLASLFLPYFNQLLDKNLQLSLLDNLPLLIGLITITGVVFLLSGSYPALYLSRLQPLKNLKAIGTSQSIGGWGNKQLRLRHLLVVSQFGVAIALIISSFFVASQLRLMMEGKLGFDEEQLLLITNPWDDSRERRLENFTQEIRQSSHVAAVSAAQNSPVGHVTNNRLFRAVEQSKDEAILVGRVAVDYDFLEVIGAKIFAGRNFTKEHSSDANTTVIINETAARKIGLKPPVVGQFIQDNDGGEPLEVIGIVKDVQYASIHEEAQPVVFYINPSMSTNAVVVRTNPGDMQATLSYLQSSWEKLAPEWPFQYQFMDERLQRMYKTELQTQQLVQIFTLLTVLVACLGLFGLATLTTERRTKEIGIRKALGASVNQLVLLLSRDFTKWIAIAFIVACPLAYWAVDYWLQNFAERVAVSWWVFALAGALAILIAWFTISYQSIRVARANPVDALRSE